MIIGICGPSGSGKTYYSKKLRKKLEVVHPDKNIIIVPMDNFYKGIYQYNEEQISALKKGTLNYDEPEMIDIDGLMSFLEKIINKKSALMPIYDFSLFNRLDSSKWKNVNGEYDIIIVEGLFAFYYEKLRKMFNLKIYLNTPERLCFERRLERNLENRKGPSGNTDKEFETEYYDNYVLASYKKYILPMIEYADIVL